MRSSALLKAKDSYQQIKSDILSQVRDCFNTHYICGSSKIGLFDFGLDVS